MSFFRVGRKIRKKIISLFRFSFKFSIFSVMAGVNRTISQFRIKRIRPLSYLLSNLVSFLYKLENWSFSSDTMTFQDHVIPT